MKWNLESDTCLIFSRMHKNEQDIFELVIGILKLWSVIVLKYGISWKKVEMKQYSQRFPPTHVFSVQSV